MVLPNLISYQTLVGKAEAHADNRSLGMLCMGSAAARVNEAT
jgi:hypothetical protein